MRLLGRTDDAAILGEAISGRGLISVVGPPGVGKSSLSRAIAREAEAIWCELNNAFDLTSALIAVAEALEIDPKARDARELDEEICRELRRIRTPLFLDNVEQLLPEIRGHLERWREASKRALVVTSRHEIEAADERVIALGPLEPNDAVALFCQRAREADENATVDPDSPAPREICQAVDNLPHPIELLAYQTRVLSPEQLLGRLEDRMTLAKTQTGDRRFDLEAAIAWSWELLDEDEESIARSIACLNGGFTVVAGEALGHDALHLVDALRRKHLVYRVPESNPPRFKLFENVRAYIESTQDLESQRERAAEWLMSEVGDGEPPVEKLEAHRENLMILARNLAPTRPSLAFECVGKLISLYERRGPLYEVLAWLERAESWELSTRERARLSLVRGQILRRRYGHMREAANDFSTAMTLARNDEDLRCEAQVLLGGCLIRLGEPGEQHVRSGLEIARRRSLPVVEATALSILAESVDSVEEKIKLREESVKMCLQGGQFGYASMMLHAIAIHYFDLGRDADAFEVFERSAELAERHDDEMNRLIARSGLAYAHAENGDISQGTRMIVDVIAEERTRQNMPRVYMDTASLAAMCLATGNDNGAKRLLDETLEYLAEHPHVFTPVVEIRSGIHGLLAGEWQRVRPALNRSREILDYPYIRDRVCLSGFRALLAGCCGESDELEASLANVEPMKGWPSPWPEIASRIETLAARLLESNREDFDRESARPGQTPRNIEDAILTRIERGLAEVAVLSIAADGSTFRLAGEEHDLRRRRALPEILSALLAEYPNGDPIELYDLFEIGWPGERAGAEQAAARVYSAIRSLRKLGLDDYVLTASDGYLLNPELPIDQYE